jgi:hypothetical protein
MQTKHRRKWMGVMNVEVSYDEISKWVPPDKIMFHLIQPTAGKMLKPWPTVENVVTCWQVGPVADLMGRW